MAFHFRKVPVPSDHESSNLDPNLVTTNLDHESSVSIELGGPWAFYQQFYIAHDLTAVMSFLKPQTALSADHALWVPLLLHNDSEQARDITLHASLPNGWTPPAKDAVYHLEPHSSYPAQIFLVAPATKPDAPPEQLHWSITDDGKEAGEVALTVYMEFNGVPQ
jgi:hypothetical protein